jgi:hypothetical protein
MPPIGAGFQFWQLPILAILAIFVALCLRPSAIDPPPISVLLQTNTKVQFDRTVTERSKPFFFVFQPSDRAQFQPAFLLFSVRSAEGRKRRRIG